MFSQTWKRRLHIQMQIPQPRLTQSACYSYSALNIHQIPSHLAGPMRHSPASLAWQCPGSLQCQVIPARLLEIVMKHCVTDRGGPDKPAAAARLSEESAGILSRPVCCGSPVRGVWALATCSLWSVVSGSGHAQDQTASVERGGPCSVLGHVKLSAESCRLLRVSR